MTNQEFKAYVNDQKRQGISESQIARSLGMSLAHFMGRLNGVDVDKIDPPKTKKPDKKKKIDPKPVSGAEQPKYTEVSKGTSDNMTMQAEFPASSLYDWNKETDI